MKLLSPVAAPAALACWAAACGGLATNEQGNDGGTVEDGSGGGREAGSDGRSSGGVEAATADSGGCAPGESLCSGVCVDEQTDQGNCGGCGLACSSPCSAGTCVEVIVTPVPGDDLAFGTHIAVDATSLYWTQCSRSGQIATVVKAPKGGGTQVTLASGPSGRCPGGIAVDATSAYWTQYSMLAPSRINVMQVPLAGGAVTTLASTASQADPFYGYDGGPIAVDASSVYYLSSGSVMKVALSGGPPTTLATPKGPPAQLALNSSHVYWSAVSSSGGDTAFATMRVPLRGGRATTVFKEGGPTFSVGASGLYWSSLKASEAFGKGEVRLLTAPLGGGATTTLASIQDPNSAGLWGMTVDSTHLYSVVGSGKLDGHRYDGAVTKVPLTGGAPTTLATGHSPSGDIAVDSTSVYWVSAMGILSVTPK